MPTHDTIVALATPSGKSAIAIVRLSGPLCAQLTEDIFDNSKIIPRRASFANYKTESGSIIDEVIYIYYENINSYTGEQILEINCHGNPLIAHKIIEDLILRGCRTAEPGEFTKTAFLNGKMDLSQAEAVADLIHARSEKALEISKKQLNGSVSNRVNSLAYKLLEIISSFEAYIDFPDDDLPPYDSEGPARDLYQLEKEMKSLVSTSQYNNYVHEGVKTVIVGPPNTGKSSLLNALAGLDRVLVSDKPGTTRDYVEEPTLFGQYLVRLIDTAGIRDNATTIENLSISKTYEQIQSADFHLLVMDSTLRAPNLPDEFLSQFSPDRTIIVENKTDLPTSRTHSSYFPDIHHCHLSALTGDGIKSLVNSFIKILENDIIIPTEDKVIISVRHAQALSEANDYLSSAREKVQKNKPAELISSDLRAALDSIGQIIGKIDNEQMLDKLFSKFCIGK